MKDARALRSSTLHGEDSARKLNPEPRRDRLREELLDREPAAAYALLGGVLQEGFERRAIGLDAVGEELAELRLGFGGGVVDPWHGKARRGHFEGARDAAALRLFEGLEEVHGDPGVLRQEIALHRHHMHDRENAGVAEIGFLDGAVIVEEAPHARIAALEG